MGLASLTLVQDVPLARSTSSHRKAAASKTKSKLVLVSQWRWKTKQSIALRASGHDAAELQHHSIPEYVSVSQTEDEMIYVQLTNTAGWSAQVHLVGCRIASWVMPTGDEILSSTPHLQEPVTGGGGIIPDFPMSSAPGAASAASSPWQISSTSADLQPDERDPEVELVLSSKDRPPIAWPFAFRAVHSISLHGDQLRSDLRIYSLEDHAVSFTAMLHSHIEVVDVSTSRVMGLDGGSTTMALVREPRQGPMLQLDGTGVDQFFFGTPDYLELDVGSGAAVALTSSDWTDTVVRAPSSQAVTDGKASRTASWNTVDL
ncbi:hypothetical protein WJX84_003376 [Apatococcus fuscideae]|uniref:Uncharacterized protein n=1 Tax=Apatococcus fuscideae TaxID=2026836 RepID=A0AAW1T3T6_9CHLO